MTSRRTTGPPPSTEIPFSQPSDRGVSAATREFRKLGEDHYLFTLGEVGIEFDIDRLRRESHHLVGELAVRCDLSGAKVIDDKGTIAIADFNVSSSVARRDRARFLADRSLAPEADWPGLLEEFCSRLLAADRAGAPSALLPNFPRPTSEPAYTLDGLRLLRFHPAILFGDGGTTKSYLALYFAGRLVKAGQHVLYADWELSGEDHRDRLERLFGADMPPIHYVRCCRPMLYEGDRLERLVREHDIHYLICDSAGFACEGPPEDATNALQYFATLRRLGRGSLTIAHTNRSDRADEKPFGSSYWHHSARATYFLKRCEATSSPSTVRIGLFDRKENLGALRAAIGFELAFTADRTIVRQTAVEDDEELASFLPLRQRMVTKLRTGAATVAELAAGLQAKPDTIQKMTKRFEGRLFTRILSADGVHRIGLVPKPGQRGDA